jgi:hypothetical protein
VPHFWMRLAPQDEATGARAVIELQYGRSAGPWLACDDSDFVASARAGKHRDHRGHRNNPTPYGPYDPCALLVRTKEYVAAPHFPAGFCRVRTKPPARVPVSCTSRAAICWRPRPCGSSRARTGSGRAQAFTGRSPWCTCQASNSSDDLTAVGLSD